MLVDETPGIKNYCAYGESANKPYFYGSHSAKATGRVPKEFRVDACL
jgi:CDGSH-type Zn-finger protein